MLLLKGSFLLSPFHQHYSMWGHVAKYIKILILLKANPSPRCVIVTASTSEEADNKLS